MRKTIAVIAGDGVGGEIMAEAIKVLRLVERHFGHEFICKESLAGGAAFDAYGAHLPKSTLAVCESSDAILFGAVGGPVSEIQEEKWKDAEKNVLLKLRKTFDLFANLRPIYGKDADFIIVRELVSGIYFGKRQEAEYHGLGERASAYDTMSYSSFEIERIARVAFAVARDRGEKRVTSVDKANVLACSRLWRTVVEDVAKEFPEVSFQHMFIDNAAMQIIKNPKQFGVLLTENMFGDILSDEASVLAGSLGLLPSASMNEKKFGLFEPIHGSAQDIAGKNIVNPIGMILSCALMLELSFDMKQEALLIKQAVFRALKDGYGTADCARENTAPLKTNEMGDRICAYLNIFFLEKNLPK
jgi:3-isopropylmalate dehydrogenase